MQPHETEKEKQINLSALWKPKPILKSSNCIKWKWYVTYSMEIWFSLFIITYCLIVKPNRNHYTDYHQKYSRKLDFLRHCIIEMTFSELLPFLKMRTLNSSENENESGKLVSSNSLSKCCLISEKTASKDTKRSKASTQCWSVLHNHILCHINSLIVSMQLQICISRMKKKHDLSFSTNAYSTRP